VNAANGPVLVCFAVKEEAAPFRRALPYNVIILVTGMGAAAAERALKARLSERDWSLVLTCGFAGGLNPALTHGAVLLDADEEFPLRPALLKAGAVAARFHCAERVAVTAYEKATLRERTGADAVEMESGIIRGLCAERGIPSATVRVLSDTAQEDLPVDFNTLLKPNGKLSLRRLAGAVLRRPRRIPALMALGRHSQSGARRLAAVLRAALMMP
jgi:adenosylhomocysteine nucleosidase